MFERGVLLILGHSVYLEKPQALRVKGTFTQTLSETRDLSKHRQINLKMHTGIKMK